MKLLVTGAGGQLGRELTPYLSSRHETVGLTHGQLDIESLSQCRAAVRAFLPDAVIHAAAYTAVDRAEAEPDRAFRVNAAGARNIALAAREVRAKLILISTDYVFDGRKGRPYREYDAPRPAGVYGKSKLAGEEFVRLLAPQSFIVRTSWVFGRHGANFVKTILRLAGEKDTIPVVNDRTGSPTSAADLCRFLEMLVSTDKYGVYHATNSGSCTWYEFAAAILAEAGLPARAVPCRTADFPLPARRPPYSVLDHHAMRIHGFGGFRPWQDALRELLHSCRREDGTIAFDDE